MIAGKNPVQGAQVFNRPLLAAGHGDHGASAERQADQIGQLAVFQGLFNAYQSIKVARCKWGQGQDQPLCPFDLEDQQLHPVAVIGHQDIGALQDHLRPRLANFRAWADGLHALIGRRQDQPQGGGILLKLVAVPQFNRLWRINRIAKVRAMRDINVFSTQKQANLSGAGG